MSSGQASLDASGPLVRCKFPQLRATSRQLDWAGNYGGRGHELYREVSRLVARERSSKTNQLHGSCGGISRWRLEDEIVPVWQRLRSDSGFVRSVAMLSGGTALGHMVTLAASPLLTRLYTPTEVGALGVFLAVAGVASVAVSLGYERAIVAADDESDAAALLTSSIVIALPLSAVAGLLLNGLIVGGYTGFKQLPPASALLLAPVVAATAAFFALRYWFIRREEYGVISRVTFTQNVARAISQVGLGAMNFGWAGLLGGELAGRAVGMLPMTRMAIAEWKRVPQTVSGLRRVLRKYHRFPQYALPSAILDSVAISAPLPLVASAYGADASGQFALVLRVLAIPLVLLGRSVADAFFGRIAAYARDRPQLVRRFFYRTALSLLLIGIVPAVGVAVFGPALFTTLFGARWHTAGLLARVLAPWALATFVVSPVSRLVFVFGGQRLKLFYDLLSLGGSLGVLLWAEANQISLVNAIAFWSGAQTMTFAVYFLILVRILPRQQVT